MLSLSSHLTVFAVKGEGDVCVLGAGWTNKVSKGDCIHFQDVDCEGRVSSGPFGKSGFPPVSAPLRGGSAPRRKAAHSIVRYKNEHMHHYSPTYN